MKTTFLNEEETRKALAEFILQSSRFSMGTQCSQFEKAFSKFQERDEAILVNSGGSANLALLQSLKNIGRLKDGDKIGFSALTWSTNVMPIIQLGLSPIPIDCDLRTLNVMSGNLEKTLESERLQAVFITNALGFAGDLEKIREICRQRGIILLEDNCESLGTELPSGKAGNFGLAATFSFFVAHHMSSIEGGMVCTDDPELSEMLRIVRANGWDRNLSPSQQAKWRKKFGIRSDFEAKYAFYDLGFNFRPTEITGFLGRYQLQFIEKNIAKREANYKFLASIARDNPNLVELDSAHLSRLSSFAFPVICKTPELKEKYCMRFSKAGVEIRPMIAGNLQRQPFFPKYVKRHFNLPGADFIHDCGFYFGNYPELSQAELKLLGNCLKKD
ncbi:MAG: DegT/DnrJ/EryC1/StrS family aminotransferase [Candidatus Saganbacteria bacterium]|nr:DegT/DnrJ/EryC1/StrS family aminotransferase [Candidatus Saganbacteria bacterium]